MKRQSIKNFEKGHKMKIKKPTDMAKKLNEAKETRKDETITVKTKTRILKKLRSKTGITENISLAH